MLKGEAALKDACFPVLNLWGLGGETRGVLVLSMCTCVYGGHPVCGTCWFPWYKSSITAKFQPPTRDHQTQSWEEVCGSHHHKAFPQRDATDPEKLKSTDDSMLW